MRVTQATANLVDGDTYAITGVLLAGQTDIPLGQAFTLNANPSSQIGDFMVLINGVQLFRNVGNATAAPLANGNYEEVDAGAGLTNSIRLNDVFVGDVSWAVISTGIIVDNNNIGTQQQLDALAGQIDSMVPTLASVAGVPETTFQAAPNSVDLKGFSDKLFQATADIDAAEADIVGLEASKQDKFEDKFQRKNMTSSNTPALMNFNNLIIGRTYEVAVTARIACVNNNGSLTVTHDGVVLSTIRGQLFLLNPSDDTHGSVMKFEATGTTVTFAYSGAATLVGGTSETFAVLTELNNTVETTDFS